MSCATQCSPSSAQLLETMNETCACMPINANDVAGSIAGASRELQHSLAQRPIMFAGSPVFLCSADVAYMQTLVRNIEQVLRAPSFKKIIHQRSHEQPGNLSRKISQDISTPGMFMGYDFHMTREGPQLIEINTNAGGAFLVQSLYDSLSGLPFCGGQWGRSEDPDWMFKMLIKEWRQAGRQGVPKTLAIVDESPQTQFLHPDFVLARRYFEAHGIQVHIADPVEFELNNGHLLLRSEPIDLVYNRITDFYFASPAHEVLRNAWVSNAAVVSPSPGHHARYADKRNLVALSNNEHSLRNDLPDETRSILNTLPQAWLVTADNADNLWRNRKNLFFKPAHGFAGRGAYRGSKLTKRVWAEISQLKLGSYIAQERVQAASRWVDVSGKALKYDVRAFTYDGEVQLLAARVYQGQTTNFRTPGGGFAPVVILNNEHCDSLN